MVRFLLFPRGALAAFPLLFEIRWPNAAILILVGSSRTSFSLLRLNCPWLEFVVLNHDVIIMSIWTPLRLVELDYRAGKIGKP